MYGIIYKATNNINKKTYIGKTVNSLESRKYGHIRDAKRGVTLLFHRALRKYNFNFSWEIIHIAQSKEELKEAEKAFIWLYMSNNKTFGYNLTEGGEGLAGLVFSEEHRKRIGDAHRGEKNYMYGKTYPEERKILQRNKLKGKKRSRNVIERIALTQKGQKREKVSKENNNRYKKVNDEQIIKLHNEGNSVFQIEKITGITKRIIYNRLKWNNLKAHNKLLKQIIDIDAIHSYIQKGFSYKEISNILCVSESVVSKNYRASKYYTKRRSQWDNIRIKKSFQQLNQLMN